LSFHIRLSKLSVLKTLQTYLTSQVMASLILTVAVFTFVLLLGNVLREILMLLIAGHGRLSIVAEAIVLLIPFVWVFALPMGLLTATLLVFGRFSADQELTAARASGISLISLIMPVLLLSLFCCVLSGWFSMDLGPRSRVKYLGLRSELLANLADIQWPEGRFINISTNYILYAEKIHGQKLENVTAWVIDQKTSVDAPLANIEVDSKSQQIVLNLIQARIVTIPTNGENVVVTSVGRWPIPVSLKSVKNQRSTSISDMTFIELQDKLHQLQQLQQRIPETASTNQTQATRDAARKLPENLEQVRVVMQRQLAFAFAPFGFALLGIPLGIRVHRRETNIGVSIALVLVILYYGFVMLAWQLSSRPECYPHLIVWAPNLIFQAAGAVLLWRANRGV
jgi:lipopolysaccharide export LptBFGC system permease protein LptF